MEKTCCEEGDPWSTDSSEEEAVEPGCHMALDHQAWHSGGDHCTI